MNSILYNIKAIRTELGLSQEFVATKLQMEQASYGLIENGKRKLKYEQLEQIAIIFDVNVIDIITFPDKYVRNIVLDDPVKTSVTIELSGSKKDLILKTLFGSDYKAIIDKQI